jgi:CheY-like chemotaxis protein
MNNNNMILIIDDILENLQVLGNILEAEGYEVLAASNGAEALAVIQSITQKPSLILLDILMPGLDGFEVCRRLKADPASRAIPVIFISAIGMTEQTIP